MLRYDEMPTDNAQLANISVNFPHVPLDGITNPQSIEPRLLEYLNREGYPPDSDGLKFLRTALVLQTLYWIWEFVSDGERAYAVATQDEEGKTCLSCDNNHYNLTPEQFILADYHHCL